MNLRNAYLLSGLVLAVGGCKKEDAVVVPLTPVDIYLNLTLPEYQDLQATGGWLYLTGGSEGLIVYRNSPDAFTAMDRHCTYQAADLCHVTVDESGIIARDTTCCQSAFLLLDGSVTEGPAALGLKRYNTTFNGTTLHIFN
jgi:nitrite reductase/ring-hydroxylating ferredoxin subunit